MKLDIRPVRQNLIGSLWVWLNGKSVCKSQRRFIKSFLWSKVDPAFRETGNFGICFNACDTRHVRLSKRCHLIWFPSLMLIFYAKFVRNCGPQTCLIYGSYSWRLKINIWCIVQLLNEYLSRTTVLTVAFVTNSAIDKIGYAQNISNMPKCDGR